MPLPEQNAPPSGETPGFNRASAHAQVTELLNQHLQQGAGEQEAETPPNDNAATDAPASAEDLYASPPETDELTEPPADPDDPNAEGTGEETPGVDEITNFAQLAEAIGVEPEWLYGLQVSLSDELDPIPFGEVKDKLQALGQVESLRSQVEQERSLMQQQMTAERDQLNQMLSAAQQLPAEITQAQAAAEAYRQRYHDQQYWAGLEQEDPGRAALEKQRVMEAYNQAIGQAQQLQEQHQLVVQDATKQRRQMEDMSLLNAVPEWRDPTIRKNESAALYTMFGEYGFPPEEASSIVDHRAIRMARDLYKARELLRKAKTTAEDVKTGKRGVKPLRPGGRKPGPSNAQQTRGIIEQGRKAKDLRSKTDAVSRLLRATNNVSS